MIAPCYECEDRKTACHDICDKYKDFKKNIESINEARNHFMLNRSIVVESSIRQTMSRLK